MLAELEQLLGGFTRTEIVNLTRLPGMQVTQEPPLEKLDRKRRINGVCLIVTEMLQSGLVLKSASSVLLREVHG